LKAQDKSEYIAYRISKAEETLLAAKELANKNYWNSCVNRLYYALFYAVNALLINDGVIAKSHTGVKTQFFQLYIKTGKINIKFGQLYSDLIDWRQKGDYNDFFDLSQEEVLPLLEPVEIFIQKIKVLLNLA
jgi:uncharacterized protein (UPF0332 family)